MDLTFSEKQQISEQIIALAKTRGMTQAQFARSEKLNPADISNLRSKAWAKNPQLIGVSKWIKLARIIGFTRTQEMRWNTAETDLKKYIDQQLNICKSFGFAAINCDDAGIGKSFACKAFAKTHSNVFYIDCSNCRSRTRFIRALAVAVGVESTGQLDDVFENAAYVLSITSQPLVIFDEAGDLYDTSFLDIKRLYNILENVCGFYMVGADGLRRKIERNIANKKVGFTEVFSRFGKRFSRFMPNTTSEKTEVLFALANEIMTANGITSEADRRQILKTLTLSANKDMRSVRREIIKLRMSKSQINN